MKEQIRESMAKDIHPLGQAYLDAKCLIDETYNAYLSAIRTQFGKSAHAYSQCDKLWNQDVKEAYRIFRLAQGSYIAALDAMRRAGATVHPIKGNNRP